MTLSKEGCRFSDTQKSEPEPLQKKLKIVNKPYKNTYCLGLNLQGKYLEKFGFQWHDEVLVTITENRILIEKVIDNIYV